MRRRLRIAIATAGRFHVLDLARELHSLGHDVRFYSYVPKRRACKFGLPRECHVSLLPFVAPLLAWGRLAGWFASSARERLIYDALNRAVMMRMAPCDVFTCMSGIFLEAAIEAKRRYGAQIWIHRGSRHILSQDEILSRVPGAIRPSRLAIQRELDGYAVADRIVIASHHVEQSFRPYLEAHRKLFLDPYGVDLEMFPQIRRLRTNNPFTFLFVGHWSLIKGVDVVSAAIKQLAGVRLLHVGAIGDVPFPEGDSRFYHSDPVPQWKLSEFYALADAFVLASREDGFGVVIGQALASGLPVICSDHTGGIDLAHTPALRSRIKVVPSGNADALTKAMQELQSQANCGDRWPPLGETDRQVLGWEEYGRRYNEELLRSYDRSKEFAVRVRSEDMKA